MKRTKPYAVEWWLMWRRERGDMLEYHTQFDTRAELLAGLRRVRLQGAGEVLPARIEVHLLKGGKR